jgi:riboflavin synthase
MFTGIVEAVGRVRAVIPRGDGLRIGVDPVSLDIAGTKVGDSIAVDGCCLTVVALDDGALAFDVSAETLRCTAGFAAGARVNLERALRVGDLLGGHLMSGHVDGTGRVVRFAAVDQDTNGSWRLDVEAPAALAPLIAAKGSIAVAGVSLTVNAADGSRFAVNLIPHTLAATTMGDLAVGKRVNLEVDAVARYVARLREFDR